ncbi:hypothetical protein NUW54_g14779 [Trametes sanguinea]|uniref:Uncharacterized protein n=1 Tax=Trametes sanguinea TaxID=158606 RepID=A0ACC1MAI7_9APHY|nr:hypothetical protein NUW54_g14779 [Trametes sanguinea]
MGRLQELGQSRVHLLFQVVLRFVADGQYLVADETQEGVEGFRARVRPHPDDPTKALRPLIEGHRNRARRLDPLGGLLPEAMQEVLVLLQCLAHALDLLRLLVRLRALFRLVRCRAKALHPAQANRGGNAHVQALLLRLHLPILQRRAVDARRRQHLFHNLPPAPALIHGARHLLQLLTREPQVRLIGMRIWGLFNNRGEQQWVLEQALNGLDEQRR